MGFTQLLAEERDGPLNEKQKRFIRHIQNDSRHLRDLINDLLDLSKIEAGHMELRYEVFPVDAAIAEVLASVQPRASGKSLNIGTDISISKPVCADRLRFKQILDNLLANAITFTPQGGSINVEARGRGYFAEISVSDTGIGISEDQQQAVFDKFHQVREVMQGRSEGTGLGLAITKQLVEQHGGRISLKSSTGNGTRFTFTVPFEQAL
jgi:signal transduction histidine kinase